VFGTPLAVVVLLAALAVVSPMFWLAGPDRALSILRRVFFVATRPEAVYVLHAFEKRTQKTSAHDLRIGRDRFRVLKKLGQQHGKEKRG
jgi:hypothetical protein